MTTLAVSCAGTSTSGDDLRIERPNADGVELLEIVSGRLIDSTGPNLEDEAAMLDAATPGQRALYALWVVDAEVENGGFEQLLYNTGGSVMGDAIEGAELVMLPRHERVLRQAETVFEDVQPRTEGQDYGEWLPRGKTGRTLSTLGDRWASLQNELFRGLARYVEAHPDEFFR